MKTRRLGAIGESEARTQRASERGQAVECFVSLAVLRAPGTAAPRIALNRLKDSQHRREEEM